MPDINHMATNTNSTLLPCREIPTDSKRMRQSVQRLPPIRLAFNCCVRGFFPKIQLYSAVRMDESFQLANETTKESLLELGSVLDVSVNDLNEELSAGPNKTCVDKHGCSLSTKAEPIPWTKDPTKSLKCDAKPKKED